MTVGEFMLCVWAAGVAAFGLAAISDRHSWAPGAAPAILTGLAVVFWPLAGLCVLLGLAAELAGEFAAWLAGRRGARSGGRP